MELNMREIFFCKIDQIQVVWEMRIFYYCIAWQDCNRLLTEILTDNIPFWNRWINQHLTEFFFCTIFFSVF